MCGTETINVGKVKINPKKEHKKKDQITKQLNKND